MAGVAGGLLWLDRYQVCQVMISRPIVAAPLVGWIVGDFAAGLSSGILFELLWLRTPPVGGFIAPDSTLAAIATTAVSTAVGSTTGIGLAPAVFLSFLFLLPLCFVGKKVDELLRLGLGKIAKRAADSQIRGEDRVVYVHLAAGMVLGFVCAFLVLVLATEVFTFLLSRMVQALPAAICKSLGLGLYLVPLLGAADLLVGMDEMRHKVLFLAGLIAAVAVGLGLAS